MGGGWIGLLVVVAVLVMVALWAIGIYNALQRARIGAEGAFSNIDVELRRRHDLVPNLVETVKGYATHERQTLEAVMQARSAATSARTMGERIEAEGQVVTDKLFYMKQEIGNACGTVRLCVCGLPATVPTGSLRSSSPP